MSIPTSGSLTKQGKGTPSSHGATASTTVIRLSSRKACTKKGFFAQLLNGQMSPGALLLCTTVPLVILFFCLSGHSSGTTHTATGRSVLILQEASNHVSSSVFHITLLFFASMLLVLKGIRQVSGHKQGRLQWIMAAVLLTVYVTYAATTFLMPERLASLDILRFLPF